MDPWIHGSTDTWIHGYGVFVASLRGDSQLSGETRSCLSQTGAGFLLTLQTPPTFDSLRRTGGGGEVGGRGWGGGGRGGWGMLARIPYGSNDHVSEVKF